MCGGSDPIGRRQVRSRTQSPTPAGTQDVCTSYRSHDRTVGDEWSREEHDDSNPPDHPPHIFESQYPTLDSGEVGGAHPDCSRSAGVSSWGRVAIWLKRVPRLFGVVGAIAGIAGSVGAPTSGCALPTHLGGRL